MSAFKLTRRSDYSLVILTALAQKGVGEMLSLSQLSREKHLPLAFASQIGKQLVRAGIIGSKEGRGGGYYLIKDPRKINLKELLETLEGKIDVFDCVKHQGKCRCEKVCIHRSFMSQLSKQLEELLAKYTLADIIDDRYVIRD